MPTLTLALIVKNESDSIEQCLASCKGLVDEIIVVDSGSIDNTQDIALAHGAKVWMHDQWQGFGQQRRIAQNYATCDWILWLDADERLSPELKHNIQQAIQSADQQTLFELNLLPWVFGRFIRHSGWHPDRKIRLYPRALTSYNDSPVHERVIVPARSNIKKLDGDILHFTYRDMQHYLVKSANYAQLWAQQRELQGKKSSLMQGLVHGAGCFLKMYVLKAGFLDGKQGFLLAILSAHSTFVKYADLWVRHQPKKP
jgi:(heptosyl)LPS beta-1,4-glucosyltransferase